SWSSPVFSSKAATSVKVPPTSADSRIRDDSIVLKQDSVEIQARGTISTAAMGRNAGHCSGGLPAAQLRHHLADEAADRLQGFPQRQIAEGELPDQIVAAGLVELGGEELRHRRRRAGDALAALDHEVEGRRARVRLLAVVQPEQVGKARMPDQ